MQPIKLIELILEFNFTSQEKELLVDASFQNIQFFTKQNKYQMELHCEQTLPFDLWQKIFKLLSETLDCPVDLIVQVNTCKLDAFTTQQYLRYFASSSTHYTIFNEPFITIEKDIVTLLFTSENSVDEATTHMDFLHQFMIRVGISYAFKFTCKNCDFQIADVKKPLEEAKPSTLEKPSYRKRRVSMDNYIAHDIKDIHDECQNIVINGMIFKIDTILIKKTSRIIQTLFIQDDEDAITLKRFETERCPRELLEEIQVNDRVNAYGSVRYDNFAKELVFFPESIVKLQNDQTEGDNALNKRVELHAHTNKSEMDGICEVNELISQAHQWGHNAIAITDHMVVQAFPKAQATAAKLNSKSDHKIKVLYGIEMNMVDSRLQIIRNATKALLSDSHYVVFDLETTGLSCRYDHIIEFGAVLIHKGEVLKKLQLFIKPPVLIRSFISMKTNITNEDVANAQPIEECIDQILDFIGDFPLVAHNASFDYGFLNEVLMRLGRPLLMNPVIDTLDLSKALHSDRRSYRLGNIARFYHITYDEEVAHRADYDADILASIFMMICNECKNLGCKTLADLDDVQNEDAFKKIMKRHVTLLVKNQAGLKDLFKLVTLSHTQYLAVTGKSVGKSEGDEVMAEPRILREAIALARSNLLIGTACFNSEVFEKAMNRSQNELEEVMSFYDYIEIQPLENYRPLIESNTIPDLDRLKLIITNLIETAKKLNKIVVATGDVHYVRKDQKILRDIYIQAQGIGGVRHPLYIYDSERRKKTVSPMQHFQTTEEMLKAFDYLGPDLAYELVCVNPNKIADSIEETHPIKEGLYPPKIEGATEKLIQLCYENAHLKYGEVLPEIVDARLKRELHSITTHEFGVIYYIAHLLVKKSLEDGYLVGSRGSVGSSLVATLTNITEVNPLVPHYICPKCKHSEFFEDGSVSSGYDLKTKACPVCQTMMEGEGQNVQFETFLGFEGDKTPDIDLNFSGDYQEYAHAYTKVLFGEDYVVRAGTIGTVAEKTAFGYVSGYCEENGIEDMRYAQRARLASGCGGVKRTTGQHPGGIIVIPNTMDVHDFTPINYPANNPNSEWKTSHFEFHDIDQNLLKLDILGHVDPTAMKLLEKISGLNVLTIPMNDPETMSIFGCVDALNVDKRIYSEKTGAVGLPEFGTAFVRQILEITKPEKFSDLLRISGLSHGTDVWLNNAKDLVEGGLTLQDVIGCRDDIMIYLMSKGVEAKTSFLIMEAVRKGKGLSDGWIKTMQENKVPEWYIESCKKIKYLFPKAHAVAYVIMAVRIAWFKVHYPHFYYVAYFTLRCDAYDIETMVKGLSAVTAKMDEITARMNNPETKRSITKKDTDLYSTFENCCEMFARGYRFDNIDINRSLASEFCVDPENNKIIIPPFTSIDGLGMNVANSIIEARQQGDFLSKEDLASRTQLSTTLIRRLEVMGVISHLQDENQLSLF